MVTAHLEREFIAAARAAGAEVERFAGITPALDFGRSILRDLDVRDVTVSPDLSFPAARLKGWPILKPGPKKDYLKAGAGLVRADYGISKTGTLVHLDRSDEEKMVWTLPPVCLCLLEAGRIVPDLDVLADVLSRHLDLTDQESPQVSLVTGPSRTADIECELSLGVHGPGRLVVLLFGDEPS
jgi:L-lactate dehydrogenase complex protein LldG